MTTSFKTILVATDLTHSGSCALQYARKIAQLRRSTLVVVHAVDPAGFAFPDGLPQISANDQAARQAIRKIEEETRAQGIEVHSLIETGLIYERILQAVADHHADLLVLGTRAAAGAGRAALGTVARRLLASASCPILTVPPAASANLSHAGLWERVLVATDFSAASLAALGHAQNITGSQLFVIYATVDSGREKHARHLERLRFVAPFNESHTLPVEHIVAEGDAGRVIAEQANRLHADLVVLGAPPPGSLLQELQDADLQTSTVLQVVAEATCPVLCVPWARSRLTARLKEELVHSH
jgi:nucleotide-binding universal stress UspA family protein